MITTITIEEAEKKSFREILQKIIKAAEGEDESDLTWAVIDNLDELKELLGKLG